VLRCLVAEKEQAEQQRDAAHAALTKYGRHHDRCERQGRPGLSTGTVCTCKLDAALAASAPQKSACDCGAALTLCVSCAVAEWQAAHPECPACCPIAPAQETERGR
jgi:hypothetical protein